MLELRELFQALNNEADPYRVSIEPLSFTEATLNVRTLMLSKNRSTSRVYFKISNPINTLQWVNVEGHDELVRLYDKYGRVVTELTTGYYMAIFNGTKCILLNSTGLSKEELLKFDVIGETIVEMFNVITGSDEIGNPPKIRRIVHTLHSVDNYGDSIVELPEYEYEKDNLDVYHMGRWIIPNDQYFIRKMNEYSDNYKISTAIEGESDGVFTVVISKLER